MAETRSTHATAHEQTRNAKREAAGNRERSRTRFRGHYVTELATIVPDTPEKGLGRNPTLSTDEHNGVRKDPERTDKTRKYFVVCPRPKEAGRTQQPNADDDRQADDADAERRNQYKTTPFYELED